MYTCLSSHCGLPSLPARKPLLYNRWALRLLLSWMFQPMIRSRGHREEKKGSLARLRPTATDLDAPRRRPSSSALSPRPTSPVPVACLPHLRPLPPRPSTHCHAFVEKKRARAGSSWSRWWPRWAPPYAGPRWAPVCGPVELLPVEVSIELPVQHSSRARCGRSLIRRWTR
jgi:hypothetical protein